MTITDIFDELDSIYNQQWFIDAEQKFKNHPLNKNREEKFSITIIDYEEEYKTYTKTISLEDFVLGARDKVFDDIHDDLEEQKLVVVGELPDGSLDYKLPDHVQFNSSNEYYPIPSLGVWKKNLKIKINKSLSLISSLAEKELFLDSLNANMQFYKKEFIDGDSNRQKVLKKILNKIQSYYVSISSEIIEINTFMENNPIESKIQLNLSQTQLAKLVHLMFEKKYIEENSMSRAKVVEWISKKFLTQAKPGVYESPKSFGPIFRRLSSQTHTTLKSWIEDFNIL